MAVTFQLPASLEDQLRHNLLNLDAEAKEALLVALYRQRRVTRRTLSEVLGADRLELEDILHRHSVTEDLGAAEEYIADAEMLGKLRNGVAQ